MSARATMVPHDLQFAGLTAGFTGFTTGLTTGNDRAVPPGDRLES
jgi:hypothetical protein